MSHSLRAALPLSVSTLTCLFVHLAGVSCQRLQSVHSVTHSSLTTQLALYSFHGAVETGQEALQDVIVHILLKPRRQSDGSFLVRTVTYLERSSLQEGQEFAPVPQQLDLYFRYKPTPNGNWEQLQFRPFETLQPQGPFVHQAEVPADVATQEVRLTVSKWPQYYALHLESLIDTDATDEAQIQTRLYRNAVVIGDVHSISATLAAKLLATHMAYHMALGFDEYLLYTRGPEITQALHQNSITAGYLQQGQLIIVSLDSLQTPQYGPKAWAEWAAYDPTKLISYNHAALLLWGERYHLAVLDIDELLSSRDSSSTVHSWFDSCHPGADSISVTRVEVVCSDCLSQGISELSFFEQAWDASNPTEILRNFSTLSSFNADPKSVFDPEKVGQVWLHRPAPLPGAIAVDVVIRDEAELAESCVSVVHLLNLFKDRIQNTQDAAKRHEWLIHRHRPRTDGIVHI